MLLCGQSLLCAANRRRRLLCILFTGARAGRPCARAGFFPYFIIMIEAPLPCIPPLADGLGRGPVLPALFVPMRRGVPGRGKSARCRLAARAQHDDHNQISEQRFHDAASFAGAYEAPFKPERPAGLRKQALAAALRKGRRPRAAAYDSLFF